MQNMVSTTKKLSTPTSTAPSIASRRSSSAQDAGHRWQSSRCSVVTDYPLSQFMVSLGKCHFSRLLLDLTTPERERLSDLHKILFCSSAGGTISEGRDHSEVERSTTVFLVYLLFARLKWPWGNFLRFMSNTRHARQNWLIVYSHNSDYLNKHLKSTWRVF